jgi:cell division protein FtsL
MAVKKVWITEHDADLVSLSMESEVVEPEYRRLKIEERAFPDKPTVKHPKRHTISVKLLSMEDLELIIKTIEAYLTRD